VSAPNQTARDLLAAILRNPDLLSEADRLRAEDLETRAHGLTLDAMRAVQASGALLDHRTLRLELERGGNLVAAGGNAFIGELITGDVRLESVRPFVDALAEDSLRRRASRACSDMRERLEDGDAKAGAVVSEGIAALSRLAEGGSESTSCEGAALLRACTGAVETLLSGEGLGRSTGFPGLDALGVRLSRGEVTVIAAGTSRGKSALGAQIAYHVAKDGGRAAFASLEMSQSQTLRRFVALEARVPLDVMRANAESAAMVQKLTRASSRVANSGLIVVDLSRDSRLSRLIASAQAAKARGGLDVLVIDYLGLLNLDGPRGRASKYETITELSREVKLAALRLGVAVILLAQFSREPEKREGGRPQLSDLRDSGAIEQDADAVVLIHRAALSMEGALLVAKNRNGPLGEVPITFDGATFAFRESTEGAGPPLPAQ
jgi:replicative DNA helicase